jgi:hypothetical protein
MKQSLIRELEPVIVDPDTDEKELLRGYVTRVRRLLPNFPRDVVIQWLYRHFHWFIYDYAWLDFDHLRFELQSWPTAQIITSVTARDNQILEDRRKILWSDLFPDKSPLEASMIRRGTWPRPIIVLNNTGIRRRVAKHLGRYHLLEGHRRCGYLRGLADRNLARPTHHVWLVSWQK